MESNVDLRLTRKHSNKLIRAGRKDTSADTVFWIFEEKDRTLPCDRFMCSATRLSSIGSFELVTIRPTE